MNHRQCRWLTYTHDASRDTRKLGSFGFVFFLYSIRYLLKTAVFTCQIITYAYFTQIEIGFVFHFYRRLWLVPRVSQKTILLFNFCLLTLFISFLAFKILYYPQYAIRYYYYTPVPADRWRKLMIFPEIFNFLTAERLWADPP